MPNEIISQFSRIYAFPIETYRQVQTAANRDAIPTGIRWLGMLVYVVSDGTTYELSGGLSNSDWVDLKPILNVGVEDLLTSTSTANALSANQGRILNDSIDNLETTKLDDAPADGSEYVRLNGLWSVATGGGGGGDLSQTDIDTLAKLNAIIVDATLIDTADSRLSDSRTPTAHSHIIGDVTGLQTALDGKASTSHTHVAANITDFDVEVSNNASVAANTAKISYTDAAAVSANTAKISYTDAAAVAANTAKISYTDAAAVAANTAKISYTDAAAVSANTAKISATGNELEAADINTLAELNAIVSDATLIDTTDSRLSDARTPTSHTHVIGDVTGLQIILDSKVAASGHTMTGNLILNSNIGIVLSNDAKIYSDGANYVADMLTTGDFIWRYQGAQKMYLDAGTGNLTVEGIVKAKGSNAFRTVGTGVGTANTAYSSFYESNGTTRQGYVGFGSGSANHMYLYNDTTTGYLLLDGNGGLSGLKFNDGAVGTHTVYHTGNDDDLLGNKANLGNGTNLDDITETGLYHQNSDAEAGAGSNYPGTAKAGMLTVTEAEGFIYQVYHEYTGYKGRYWRSRYNSIWSAWEKAYTSVDSLDATTFNLIGRGASGNRWGVMPEISSGGVMEVGRYLDFHRSDADTSDFSMRMDQLSASTMRVSTAGTNATAWSMYYGSDQKAEIAAFSSGGYVALDAPAKGQTFISSYGASTFAGGDIKTTVGNSEALDHINTSDLRLKKNISTYTPKKINANWVTWEWRQTSKKQPHKLLGTIAQQLEIEHPEFIITDPETGYKAVRYNSLFVAKIAELEHRISLIEEA